MKLAAIDIYSDYHRIKRLDPSYRLGQHYCNVLGLENMKLFNCSNDLVSDKIFYKLCQEKQWDVLNLPVFGNYDLTSIKPF